MRCPYCGEISESKWGKCIDYVGRILAVALESLMMAAVFGVFTIMILSGIGVELIVLQSITLIVVIIIFISVFISGGIGL